MTFTEKKKYTINSIKKIHKELKFEEKNFFSEKKNLLGLIMISKRPSAVYPSKNSDGKAGILPKIGHINPKNTRAKIQAANS